MEGNRTKNEKQQVVATGSDFLSMLHGPLSPVNLKNDGKPRGEVQNILKHDKRWKSGVASKSTFDEQKKLLDKAEQSVAKLGSRKKKITNLIFFIINIAVLAAVLLFQLLGKEFIPPSGLTLNWSAFFIILALFAAELLCETSTLSYLIKKAVGKLRFALAFKTNAIGRYYDAVTPLATGGQPFQITYLKGHDIPLHSALAIPLAKYVFSQIVWVIVSFVCMIVSLTVAGYASLMSVVSVIGWVLGSFMLFVTVFLSVSKNTGRKLVVKTLKLLQKMHIVKDYEKQYAKISKQIEDFQSVMQQYAKSPKDFIVLFGLMLLRLFCAHSIPFFIYCLFREYTWDLFIQFYVTTVMINLASSFFPLPGGTGMSELSFNAMFAAYFDGGYLFWALLLYRIMNYYLFLLIGFSTITYDFSYGNRKYRWQKRKLELVQESAIFKQEQINRFRAERLKRRKNAAQRF